MADLGLVRYVKERRREGYGDDEIREALLANNHDTAAVNEAIHGVTHHLHMLPIILGLLVLTGIGVAIFFSLQPLSVPIVTQEPSRPVPAPPTQGIVTLASQLQQENLESTQLYYRSVELAILRAQTSGDGILLCSVNRDIVEKNYCLAELAGARRNPVFCEVIGDVRQRDDCYLGLILDGEDQYCDDLLLSENKQVCELLLG